MDETVGHYTVNLRCKNCLSPFTEKFVFGVEANIDDSKCPRCGCVGAVKAPPDPTLEAMKQILTQPRQL